jgi:hypothetical protein
MYTFEDLEWKARPVAPEDYDEWVKMYPAVPDLGMYARIQFVNGFGVQVARGTQTIGGSSGLFEIRVLDSEGNYCDTTIVASGTIGSLSTSQVTDYMSQIQSLT